MAERNGVDEGIVVALARRIAAQFIGVTIQSFSAPTLVGDNYQYTVTLTNNNTLTFLVPVNDNFANIFLLQSGNTNENDNGNWRFIVDGDNLSIERRESGTWVSRGQFGSSLESDKFILENTAGKLTFLNLSSEEKTLIRPSTDESGAAIGNIFGRVESIHDGELLSIAFDTTTLQTDNIQLLTDETQASGASKTYRFVTTRVEAINNITFSLANVPASTIMRYCVHTTNGELLAENVNAFDFANGTGFDVSTGLNTVDLIEELPLDSGFTIDIQVFFNNSVDIQGSTVDLGDGLGSRFVPRASITYYDGVRSNITTEANVTTQLEAKTGDNRLDANALKNLQAVAFNPADHSITEFNDVSSAGSGEVITPTERGNIRTTEQLFNAVKVFFVDGMNTTVTINDTDNEIAINATGGGTTPPTSAHDVYLNVTNDTAASSVDLASSATSNLVNPTLTIPTFTGNRYVQILQAETHTQFTSISIGGLNQIGAFTVNAAARTINSQSYRQYVSTNLLTDVVSGDTVILGGAS